MKVAVIGAGGVGSAAARHLARSGHEVLLVEQFEVDHDLGSSWGDSRVTRYTYSDPLYTRMMVEAYALWEALQSEADELLQSRTGILVFGPPDNADVAGMEASLRESGVPYDKLDAGGIRRRFPQFRVADGEVGLWQADGGFLRASRCVRANVRLASAHGARLVERTALTGLRREAGGVTLALSGKPGPTVDRVVLTTGPWAPRVLADLGLPLEVRRAWYLFLEPRREAAARLTAGECPVWFDPAADVYGLPSHGEVRGVKLAFYLRTTSPADPQTVDRAVRDGERAELLAWARERMPDLTDRVTFEKVCLYTMTPDHDFVIGQWPDDERVVLVAGLSGHGFKFTVLLGKIAADLALGNDPGYDLSRFSPTRFMRR